MIDKVQSWNERTILSSLVLSSTIKTFLFRLHHTLIREQERDVFPGYLIFILVTNKIYTLYWSDERNECTKNNRKEEEEEKRERKIFIKDSFTVLQIANGKEEEEKNSLILSDFSFLCVDKHGKRRRWTRRARKTRIEMIEKGMHGCVGRNHTQTRICTEFMRIENK